MEEHTVLKDKEARKYLRVLVSATKSYISGTTAVHLSMTIDVLNNIVVQINLNSI
jgi:hypothetical protein